MPAKLIDRLLFEQGGACFFCRRPLARSEATAEHLVAVAHGGDGRATNLVACCQALNTILGSQSLKEKLRMVLDQAHPFLCPNGDQPGPSVRPPQTAAATPRKKAAKKKRTKAAKELVAEVTEAVSSQAIDDIVTALREFPGLLPSRQPSLRKRLRKLVAHLEPQPKIADIVAALQQREVLRVDEGTVVYALAPRPDKGES